MAIYVCGDTHGGKDSGKLNSKRFKGYKNCTKDDVLIVCGDWGYVFKSENKLSLIEKENNLIKSTFVNRKWGTTLVVDGNHENHDRIVKLPIIEKFGGKVRKVMDSVYIAIRGEVYTINNKKVFTFGGAITSYKEYRKEGLDWFKGEDFTAKDIDNAIYNLNKHNKKVDYIITHCTSESTMAEVIKLQEKQVDDGKFIYYKVEKREPDNFNKLFEVIKNRVDFKHWYFGHLHLDMDINEKETVLFNLIRC